MKLLLLDNNKKPYAINTFISTNRYKKPYYIYFSESCSWTTCGLKSRSSTLLKLLTYISSR